MQNKNSRRRVSNNNNIQIFSEKQNPKKENNINNKAIRSRISFNQNNNHINYYSNAINQVKDKTIKQNIKAQNISSNKENREKEENDYLDHPQPLVTEFENLDDLKAQFTKNDKKEILEKTKDSSEEPFSNKNSKNEKFCMINTDIKNKICNLNITDNNKSENLNMVKKRKNIDNNNNDKKTKEIKINPFIKNDFAINGNNIANYNIKTFNRSIHNLNEIPKYKIMNKEVQNISTDKENINLNLINLENNKIIKNQNDKTKNFHKQKLLQPKTSFNLIKKNENTTVRKLVFEECEKNNNLKYNIINTNQTFSKNNLNNRYREHINHINISDNNNNKLNSYNFSQNLTEEKKTKNNINVVLPNKENIIIMNNYTYNKKNSRIISEEIKMPEINKKYDIKKQINNNGYKIRKNTFEKVTNFNNTKTTYVVISKKSGQIPKSNFTEIIKPKISVITKQKSLNNVKNQINKQEILKVTNSYSFRENKLNSNRRRNFLINKSQKRFSLVPRNNQETNFRNYIASSINENNKKSINSINNNKFSLINKSVNNRHNLIPHYTYDFNYDYGYYYDNYTYDENLVHIDYTSSYNNIYHF